MPLSITAILTPAPAFAMPPTEGALQAAGTFTRLTATLRFRLRRGSRTTRLTPASERSSATRSRGTRTKTAFNKVSAEPPAGTVVVIKYLDTTVKVGCDVPLKVTLVAPVRSLPRILTAAPTAPEVVCVSTNGPRPTDRLKTVPPWSAPPVEVVP